jgi:hypothetical protein
MMQIPEIKSFSDVRNHVEEINAFVKSFPLEDYVYCFPNPFPEKYQAEDSCPERSGLGTFAMIPNTKDTYIAGSAAVHYVQSHVANYSTLHWKPNDADMFTLGCKVNNRYSLGIIDIVQAKEETIEELLLNFDLGCCRAAFDRHLNIWVSIQCLSAIFNHKYPMPKYMKDRTTFLSYLSNNRTGSIIPNHGGAEDMMYVRFMNRIKKYSDRGFGVTWINTTKALPWIKNRFHYAEWKPQSDVESEKEVEEKTFANDEDKLRMLTSLISIEMIRTKCGGKSKKEIILKELENGLDEERFSLIMREFEKDSANFLMNKLDRDLCDSLISGKDWKNAFAKLFSNQMKADPFVNLLLTHINNFP